MNSCIAYQKAGRVGVITMLQETMKDGFFEEMMQILDDAEKDNEIGAVLLKNDGRFFCAGGDLSSGAKRTQMEAKEFILRSGRLSQKLSSCAKPVIALVNGAAAGGGCNLAFSCDFVLASEKAKFREVFVNINFIPDTGGLWNLVRLAGPMRAKELCLTGRVFGPEEAYTYGLVTKVCNSEELYAEGLSFAEELASKPPQAVQYIKQICYRIPEMTQETYLEYETSIMALLRATDDHAEGVQAFFEKRPPVFSGR